MANIVSAGVSLRFQSLADAAGRALNLASAVAEILTQRLSRVLREGETMPDIAFLQVLIARSLALYNQELEESDQQRKHLKGIEVHRRVVMEAASEKLRSALVDVRYSLDRTLTKKEAKAVFEGRSNLTRLKSPVLERVSERLILLLEEPSFGWSDLADSGHRITVETNKARLQAALAEFHQAQEETAPKRDALLTAQGSFERDYQQKGIVLRSFIRLMRGIYLGIEFEREAAALVLRRRKTSSPDEEEPAPPEPVPPKAAVLPAPLAPAMPTD